MTFLEQLRESDSAAVLAQKQYTDLVAKLANGTEDPTLSDVQAILAAVAKTPRQLAADVGVRKQQIQRNEA